MTLCLLHFLVQTVQELINIFKGSSARRNKGTSTTRYAEYRRIVAKTLKILVRQRAKVCIFNVPSLLKADNFPPTTLWMKPFGVTLKERWEERRIGMIQPNAVVFIFHRTLSVSTRSTSIGTSHPHGTALSIDRRNRKAHIFRPVSGLTVNVLAEGSVIAGTRAAVPGRDTGDLCTYLSLFFVVLGLPAGFELPCRLVDHLLSYCLATPSALGGGVKIIRNNVLVVGLRRVWSSYISVKSRTSTTRREHEINDDDDETPNLPAPVSR